MTFKRVCIDVTEAAIRLGKRASYVNCPIAKAARRVVGRRVLGSTSTTLFLRSGVIEEIAISLPAAARRFIYRYDEEKPVKPFAFTVKVPNA